MKYEEFILLLTQEKPPLTINKYLLILWYDSKGKWDIAHNLAQAIYNRDGSLLHAYLHRKEGDIANAAYWYSNADKEMPNLSIQKERENLVKKYLNYKRKDR
jgi:hypothetical protein